MKLSDILNQNHVIPDLKAKDKKGVLAELVDVIVSSDPTLDKNSLVKVLLERERLGSTGIGDGVAIPHGKFQGLKHPIISFGRSRKGLDFDAMDGEAVFLFFLLVAPEDSASIHLKALAKIAKIIKSRSFRNVLMQVPTREEIYQTIILNDEQL